MKKFHSLVFYLKNKNKKLYINTIKNDYIEPICKYFNHKVDKVTLDNENSEKEYDYNSLSLNDFYIDSNNKSIQFLTFFSNETTNDEPIFLIKFKSEYNQLEIRIDYENIDISIEEYKKIVDVLNNNLELRYSFLYDYNDKWNILYLSGIECGIMTFKRRKLIKEIKHHNSEDFFDSIIHIFSLNYINIDILSKDKLNAIIDIVGEGNYYLYNKKGIIFKCGNHFIKRRINKLLK